MAYVTSTRSVAHEGFGARIAASFRSIGERWEQYRVYSRTLSELSSLSDRELNDLGLTRGMIPGVAMEASQRTA